MPSSADHFIYWDSNVFLAYIHGEPGRANLMITAFGSHPDPNVISQQALYSFLRQTMPAVDAAMQDAHIKPMRFLGSESNEVQ